MGIDLTTCEAGGLVFDLRTAGPPGGEPVMLLHGFPETSAMWDDLMTGLADAGYRCAAPDQRGYSAGARPGAVTAYVGAELAADVYRLADALGWTTFHLVAHDWGAAVAWQAVQLRPDRVISLTALSVPHYRAFAEATWEDADTELYRGFLGIVLGTEGVAEQMFGQDDMAGLRAFWVGDDRTVQAYADVFAQPGALRATLAWYRAADGHRTVLEQPPGPGETVTTPTVLLWGRDDPFVRRGSVDRAARFMAGPYEVVELAAGHWLAQEAGPQVRAAVLAHLGRHPRAEAQP